jgi:carbon storage regulator
MYSRILEYTFLAGSDAMLVLSRKLGETVVIDDEIVLKVTQVQGNRVKLSLEAPRSRRILRGEIAEQNIRAGSQPAAASRRDLTQPAAAANS